MKHLNTILDITIGLILLLTAITEQYELAGAGFIIWAFTQAKKYIK